MKIGRTTLEAVHGGPAELEAWLATLTPQLTQELGHPVVTAVVDATALEVHKLEDPQGLMQFKRIAAPLKVQTARWGVRRDFLEQVARPYTMSGPSMFRLFYSPFRISTAESLVGKKIDVAKLVPQFAPGFVDLGCMRADAGKVSLTCVVPLQTGQSLPIKDRGLLRLQRHLAGAFAKRVRPAWKRSAVVFDASGRVVHSDVKRAPPHLRELRSLVARELDQRSEPDEQAELVWDELWKSGWTVARGRRGRAPLPDAAPFAS